MNKRNYFHLALQDTPLYGMTASQYTPEGNITAIKKMIEAGLKIIQYREKELGIREQLKELREIRELTWKQNVFLVVNDHIDLAMSVKADGIHLGQDDLPLLEARKLVGNSMVIGISTHNKDQLKEAMNQKADYVGAGPAFFTNTKPQEEVAGVGYVKVAIKESDIPVIVLGGVTESNLDQLVPLGVKNVCMVKDFFESDDWTEKHRRVRRVVFQ